ncbi:hypothetical protein BC835DRAFT_1076343 [Cytidiella melzeri]|nr:hypothetical protein BC835DRAFT_1076343 [Cytidiella melzeri]
MLLHLYFVDAQGGKPEYMWTALPFYRWLTVSHICRRWRCAALATPRMWAAIVLTRRADCIATMIQRSRQAPLMVYEDASYLDNSLTHSKELVLREIHRIRHLRILFDSKACALLSALDAKDAPLLKALDITYSNKESDGDSDPIPTLSSWTLPSLIHLSFHDRTPEWDETDGVPDLDFVKSLLRATLVSLNIDALRSSISVGACLDLLRGLPMLESHALGNVLSPSKPDPCDIRPPLSTTIVTLQHLRDISIQRTNYHLQRLANPDSDPFDSGVGAADLLRHLDITASTSVYFTVGAEDLSSDQLHFIFSVLRDKVTANHRSETLPETLPFINGRVVASMNLFVTIELSSTPMSVIGVRNRVGSPPFEQSQTLRVTMHKQYPGNVDSIRMFFTHGFPLSKVLTVDSLDYTGMLKTKHWDVIHQAVPGLQEVVVPAPARKFIRAVNTELRSSELVGDRASRIG